MQGVIRFTFIVLLLCTFNHAFPSKKYFIVQFYYISCLIKSQIHLKHFNIFLLEHGFPNQNHPNLEFKLEDLHRSIKPDLLKSLQQSKQNEQEKIFSRTN